MTKYNFNTKMTLGNPEQNSVKLDRRYKAVSLLNDYDNVSYKYNDKKSKLIVTANKQNIFEIFYGKDYHICTKVNLINFDKTAKYHELWDMKYDIRTTEQTKLASIIDYILTEYAKLVNEYNTKIAK